MNRPDYETVFFHLTQSLREHFLAYTLDRSADVSEAQCPIVLQNLQNKHRPFIGNLADDVIDKSFNRRIYLHWGFSMPSSFNLRVRDCSTHSTLSIWCV